MDITKNLKNIMNKTQVTDFFILCKESRIESNTSFYGCFYVGPFDESLSQTLANNLRRTLLAELPGLAITSVEIEGVLHQFSSLTGMKESVLDVISNLQGIVLKKQLIKNKMIIKKTFIGFLNVNGPRVIKASDLKLPYGIVCVDPNQYIATLAEDGILNMKFTIKEGKNFIKQKPKNLDVNITKRRNILLQNLQKQKLDNMGVFDNRRNQFDGSPFSNSKSVDTDALGASAPNEDFLDNIFNESQILTTKKPNILKYFMFKNKKFSITESRNNFLHVNVRHSFSKGSVPIPLDAVFMPVTKINCMIEENSLYTDFHTDSITTKEQELEETIKTLNINNKKRILKNKINFSNFKLKKTLAQDKTHTIAEHTKVIPWTTNKMFFSSNNSLSFDSNFFWSDKPTDILHILLTNNFSSLEIVDFLNQKNMYNLFYKSPTNKINQFLGYFSQNSNKILKFTNTINHDLLNISNISNLEYYKILQLKPLRKKNNLIVEIWTNGSIHPKQALNHAFIFLTNNFLKLQTVKNFGTVFKSDLAYGNLNYSIINNFENLKKTKLPLTRRFSVGGANRIIVTKNSQENFNFYHRLSSKSINKKTNVKKKNTKILLEANISILKTSLRAYIFLKKSKILTLKDLVKYSRQDLLTKINLDIKSLIQIETNLAFLGLSLKN